MALETLPVSVETLEEIPETVRPFYKEHEGKFLLKADGVEDVSGLKNALKRQSEAAKAAKAELQKFANVDLEEYERLREAATGKDGKDKDEVAKLIAKRVGETEEKYKPLLTEVDRLKAKLRSVLIDDARRSAALKAGILPDSIDDVMLVSARYFDLDDKEKIVVLDDDGDPTSLSPEKFFSETFKKMRPRYYPPTGASGSGADGKGGGGGKGATSIDTSKLPPVERMKRAYAAGPQQK